MRQCRVCRSLFTFIAVAAFAGMAPCAAAAQQPASAAHDLDWLVGNWSVRQSFWSDATKAPAIDTGSAVFSSVLEGRHLRQDLAIASPKPFRGLGYLGYDDAASRYDSLWMDVNFGGVVVAHGGCSADGRSCTFRGAMAGTDGGVPVPVREVLEAGDADHFSYAYYERRDGRERLTVKLEYTRVK